MLLLDRQGSVCAISVVADLGASLDPEDPGLPLSERGGAGGRGSQYPLISRWPFPAEPEGAGPARPSRSA